MRASNERVMNNIVTSIFNLAHNNRPGICMPRAGQVAYILQKEVSRLFRMHDGHDVEEQGAARAILETLLMTGFRERLTRKAGAEYVVIEDLLVDGLLGEIRILVVDIFSSQRTDILIETPLAFRIGEVGLVDNLALRIDLTGKFALVAKISEGPVKPADTCE